MVHLAGVVIDAAILFADFSLPLFVFFVVQRRHQINHPRLELNPTLPAQIALAILFPAFYGILMPIGYQLLVRSHDTLFSWGFAPAANPLWLILVQSAVMGWLGARLVQAASSRDVPRFGGWIDRLMASAGIFLVAWVLGHILPHFIDEFGDNYYFPTIRQAPYVLRLLFPMTCLAAALLIFSLALMEAARNLSRPPGGRIFVPWTLAAAAVLLAFSPLILSTPRVPKAQALALIEANRDDIETAAALAGLDPRLLAGIIYTAQTRDESRFTGEIVRGLYSSCRDTHSPDYLPNPRFGLCPMRDSAAGNMLKLIEYHHGLLDSVPATQREREQKEHPDQFNAEVEVYFGDGLYYESNPVDFPDALVDEMRACYRIQHEILAFEQRREASYRRYLKKQASVRMEILDLANYAPALLYFKMCLTSQYTTYFNYSSDDPAPNYDLRAEKDYNFYYPVSGHWVNHHALARRLDGRLSLLVAAAELNMFDQAWRRAGFPIADRPEILATLFYLDAEIIPHALPRPNDFGRRVAAFMNSPQCARVFPKPVMVSCAREEEP